MLLSVTGLKCAENFRYKLNDYNASSTQFHPIKLDKSKWSKIFSIFWFFSFFPKLEIYDNTKSAGNTNIANIQTKCRQMETNESHDFDSDWNKNRINELVLEKKHISECYFEGIS